MGGPRKVNRSEQHDGVRVRVMCPVCNAGGAQYLKSCQPKCHVCRDGTLMEPAGNLKIECTWEQMKSHLPCRNFKEPI